MPKRWCPTGREFIIFPDSTFLVIGLMIYAMLVLGTSQYEGLNKFISFDMQTRLSLCILVGSATSLSGQIIMRWDMLLGGWIHAGGVAGLNIGLCVYMYALISLSNVDRWWATPTFWFLAGLIGLFASRFTRVCIFTTCVFKQAIYERRHKQRQP